MKPKKNATLVNSADMWTLLMCSVRYAMGRRSYMPSTVADLVRKHVDVLDDHNLLQIQKEVFEELARAERCGETLGDQVDHDGWKEFVAWIRRELVRRGHERAAW